MAGIAPATQTHLATIVLARALAQKTMSSDVLG